MPRTTTPKELFTCPACQEVVQARVAFDLVLPEDQEISSLDEVNVQAKLVGLSVAHSCIPHEPGKRATRTRRTSKKKTEEEPLEGEVVEHPENGSEEETNAG